MIEWGNIWPRSGQIILFTITTKSILVYKMFVYCQKIIKKKLRGKIKSKLIQHYI